MEDKRSHSKTFISILSNRFFIDQIQVQMGPSECSSFGLLDPNNLANPTPTIRIFGLLFFWTRK